MEYKMIIQMLQIFAAAAKSADNRVPIFVPRTPGDTDPMLFIGVNGKNYLLPKGKTSMVPPEVEYEYKRGLAAQHYSEDHINRMIDQARDNAIESERTAIASK